MNGETREIKGHVFYNGRLMTKEEYETGVEDYCGEKITHQEADRRRRARSAVGESGEQNQPVPASPEDLPDKENQAAIGKADIGADGGVGSPDEENEKSAESPIPEALDGCRFVKIQSREKRAFEKGWPTSKNYGRTDPEILDHIAGGGNYGVMPTGGVCILDADEPLKMMHLGLLELFAGTYTVRTGGEGMKFHFYFRCEGLTEKVPFHELDTGVHLGEVYGSGASAYCVGPGSVHPSGRSYTVQKDAPLKEIPLDALDEAFFSKVKCSRNPQTPEQAAQPVRRPGPAIRGIAAPLAGTISDQLGLRCEQFLAPENSKQSGHEIIGGHPIHGSETGTNLAINTLKNSWTCRRCNSGGGPLEALAVAKGIIRCDETRPGCLDTHWPEIFDALRSMGYNVATRGDTRKGIVLQHAKDPIHPDELKATLSCIARSMRDRGIHMNDALEKVTKINGSRRVEAPMKAEDVLALVEEAYKAVTFEEARRQAEINRKTPDDLKDIADQILQNGKVLPYFRDVYETIHSGDIPLLDAILCGKSAQFCLNGNGIQPGANGPLGSGKTSGIRAALHLMPPEQVFETSLSNKALFYDDRLRPGSIIFSDDTILDEDLLATMKRAMSNFQRPTEHLTVERGKDQNRSRSLFFPPRMMFIFTTIADAGDDQLNDRLYRLSTDPNPEADKNYEIFLMDRVADGREEFPVTEEVLVCWEIIRDITGHTFRVRIPWSHRVKFLDRSRRRNMGSFFDFVMASAILNYRKRPQAPDPEHLDENGILLEATIEDFEIAKEIFRYNQDTRAYDLTKEEQTLLDWIVREAGDVGIPEPDIIKRFKSRGKAWSRGKIRGILYGYRDRGGLLRKVPGMWSEQQILATSDTKKRAVTVIFAPATVGTKLQDFDDWVRMEDPPEEGVS